jgi:hypothetical protein
MHGERRDQGDREGDDDWFSITASHDLYYGAGDTGPHEGYLGARRRQSARPSGFEPSGRSAIRQSCRRSAD